jgi:hypothetical protein
MGEGEGRVEEGWLEPAEPAANTSATFCDCGVKEKTLHLKEWTLQNYIDVAHELGWITQTVRDIGDVLRDYRNYIHPHKQYSEKMSLAPEDAKISWEISKNIARQVLALP